MRMLQLASACLAGFVAVTSAVPSNNKFEIRQDNNTNSTTPCASVSSYISAHPAPTPSVPAKLAYDCLTSVPLNVSSALKLTESLKPYIEWQSTLAYLKDPPSEYASKVQDPVDVLAGLETIKSNVQGGKYSSEYQFGFELYTLFQSTHDGHFVFVPDSVGSVFSWSRPLPIVSVSEDGKKIPGIFAYEDVIGLHYHNISYTPSAIALVDGEDAAAYLENLSQAGSLQDRDALYNNVFYNLAQISLGTQGSTTGMFTGGGRGRFVYPGDTTTLTFVNGTTRVIQNYGRTSVSFRGVSTAEDLAKKVFNYGGTGSVSTTSIQSQALAPNVNHVEKRQSTKSPPPGYPKPVVQATSNVIMGYYLEGEGFDDVAVLAVPSFVSISTLEKEFQDLGDQFLAAAKAAGKSKLIIDVSANGGGTILQGYDLFKKLFPSMLPYGATRFRAHDALNVIGQTFSDFVEPFPRRLDERNGTVLDVAASYFNYQTDVNEVYENFGSWTEKFGPHEFHSDAYTSLTRWNLSDVLTPLNSGGINITGYANRQNFTVQPFESENIVIVYDGYCASTCTIFSEFMRQQGNVKTIAFGGRPQLGPIQAVGGVKGTNNFPWTYIQLVAQEAVGIGASRNGSLNDYFGDFPFIRAAGSPGSNVRDGIRQNDTEQTPLQFVYEEADCRIWYTPEMTVDVTEVWKAAADTQWNGNSRCVPNGSKQYGKRYDKSESLSGKRHHLTRRSSDDEAAFQRLVESQGLFTDPWNSDVHGFMAP